MFVNDANKTLATCIKIKKEGLFYHSAPARQITNTKVLKFRSDQIAVFQNCDNYIVKANHVKVLAHVLDAVQMKDV